MHHQSDFEMFTWLMKGPVPLSLCAADKVLPIPAEASSQLAVSYYSHSGRGDQAGPRVAGNTAHHGYAQGERASPSARTQTREHASSQSVRSRTPYSNLRAHTPCASCSTVSRTLHVHRVVCACPCAKDEACTISPHVSTGKNSRARVDFGSDTRRFGIEDSVRGVRERSSRRAPRAAVSAQSEP